MDITISKKAIDKYLSASAVLKSASRDAHLSVLHVLPRLIVDAILKETQVDRAGNKDIKGILRFYSAINCQNQTYQVKITVKAYSNGTNKAYSYEVKQKSPITAGYRDLGDEIQGGQREQYSTSSPRTGLSGGKDTEQFFNPSNK